MKRFSLYLLLLAGVLGASYLLVVRLNSPLDDSRLATIAQQSTKIEPDPVRQEVADMRRRYHLRPLTELENGTSLQSLPKGIYGFSACGATSIIAKRDTQPLIEIHKRLDGIAYYVAYASKEDIGKYLARQKNFHIRASPHATDKAPLLFEIPIDFVFKCQAHPSGQGQVYDLFVTSIPELST
jgi:hypothetical protein